MKIRLILGLMVTALLAGHAPAAPQPELAGLPGNRIEEPVFGTEAMVYAGGVTGAPTVVLVHGIGQEAAAVWEGLIEALRPHYRVITFDLPGFGASSSGNHFYSPQAYAAFLDHVIGRYAEAPVLLAGHSLGGTVALHYAADRPERVQRLLVTSVAGILHRSAYAAT